MLCLYRCTSYIKLSIAQTLFRLLTFEIACASIDIVSLSYTYLIIKLITKSTMKAESNNIGAQAINHLLQCTYRNVALLNVEKLAPTSAKFEALQLLQSHISNAIYNKENAQLLCQQADPKPISIDSLAYGATQMQQNGQKSRSGTDKAGETIRKNRRQSQQHTGQSLLSKKATSDAKPQITEKCEQDLHELSLQQSVHTIFYAQQDKIRSIKIAKEQQAVRLKQAVKGKLQTEQKSNSRNKKLFRDMKKYTYGYDGNLLGTGCINQGAEQLVKIKSRKGDPRLLKKQKNNPESSYAITNRLKEREAKAKQEMRKSSYKNQPIFDTNLPGSLLEMIQNDDIISEGVKFMEGKGGSKIIKSKPAHTGLRMCKLSEYKGMTKETKFKQFRGKASFNSLGIDKTTLSSLGSNPAASVPLKPAAEFQPIRKEPKAKSELPIINKRTLDPIAVPVAPMNKRDKRFAKAWYHKRSQSHQSIDTSGLTSRLSSSRIIVDHQDLFTANFLIRL